MGKFTKSSHLKDSREIIKVINLSKSYKSKKVLREINLNVNYGESIALIGANGSGKSTLIKCLLGLTNIEKGEIYTNQIRLNIKNNDLLKVKFNNEDLNNICDECKEEDESVSQNLILTGFKICKSCRVSKTIFPI